MPESKRVVFVCTIEKRPQVRGTDLGLHAVAEAEIAGDP